MTNKKGNVVIVIAIIVVILLVVGYLGRNQIKSMFGMNPTPTSDSSNTPSNNIYTTKTDSTKGNYMADFQGMTLYTFDKDTTGVSNCTGGCLKIWPVYTSGATAQGIFPDNVSVITRDDGTKQFAWKGMPLYYYAADTKVGDLTGDGVGGTWHIVKL